MINAPSQDPELQGCLSQTLPSRLLEHLEGPYQRKRFDTRESIRVRPRFFNELQHKNYAPFGTRLMGISLGSTGGCRSAERMVW
jgi:hypothetical protein